MTDDAKPDPNDMPEFPDKDIENLPELNELLDATEALPEERRASYQRAVISMVAKFTHASFASPIPPPEYMEAYERIAPGSTNRMLQMVEKQQEHRIKMEAVVIIGNSEREHQGQWMAFALSGIVLVSGFHLVNTGRDAQGFAVIITAVVGLLAAFNSAKNKQLADLRDRMRRLLEKPKDKELMPKPVKPES